MQIHSGVVPTDSDGGTRIIMRIVQDATIEDGPQYAFPISKAYTGLSKLHSVLLLDCWHRY